jgi:hypothetical protein
MFNTRSLCNPASDSGRIALTVNDTPGNTNAKVSMSLQMVSIVFDGRE